MTSTAPLKVSFCLWTLVLASNCVAVDNTEKTDAPSDYAYSIPLEVSGKQGVVGFRLPVEVYRNSQSDNLSDLRVFDAKGFIQPFSFYHPLSEQHAVVLTRAATAFPITASSSDKPGASSLDLDIRTQPDGAVISVQSHTGNSTLADTESLTGFILQFHPPPEALDRAASYIGAIQFGPPRGNPANYSAAISIESSNDLQKWEPLGTSELSWLTNESGQTLVSNRIEFVPRIFRYARLTWKRGTPVHFEGIEARVVSSHRDDPSREILWVKPTPGKAAGDLLYSVGVGLPVEQIRLKFSEPNIVFPVLLGDYTERPGKLPGKPAEWIFRKTLEATFYQITQNGETRHFGALPLGVIHRDELVLRPKNPATGALPELGLVWQPDTLVFLAGGTAPYTLSFGRAKVAAAFLPMNQVAPGFAEKEISRVEQAQPGPIQVGKIAPNRLQDAAAASVAQRNRTLVLWGVLLLGLLSLGGMAWKLVRQMK